MVGTKSTIGPSTSVGLAQQHNGVIVKTPFCQMSCCGTVPCTSSCHSRRPSLTESTCSRLFYILLHVGASAVCCLLLSRTVVERVWGEAHGIQMPSGLCSHLFGHSACPVVSGSGAVYRICAGTATFHLLQAVLLVHLHSPTSPRAQLHNSFWFLKVLFLLGLCAAAFCIPDEHLLPAWHYIGICGGFTFILLQLVLITAFAHSWNKNWQTGAAQDCSWFLAVLLATLGFYSMAGLGAMLLFQHYTHPAGCLLNKMLLSMHLCFCGLLSFLSIAPCIRLSGATSLWPSTSLYHQLLYHVSDLLCTVQPSSRERNPHSVSAAQKQWSQGMGKQMGQPGQLTKRPLKHHHRKPSIFPTAILPSTSSSSLLHSTSWLPLPTGSAMREQNWKRPSPRVAGPHSGSRLPHAGPVYYSIWACYWHHSVGPQPRTPSPGLPSGNTIIWHQYYQITASSLSPFNKKGFLQIKSLVLAQGS
ncbi:serine incorporator 4, transcript variant X6 [Ictidomys tridecemlineatus]|uniref:serine incorporator 4 isoform X4 n=1 Tax=Ictidomys tridecemlineatus TaxID=43179 RepID=UPI000B547AF7|nr:serine incorporator 4 isoform X4 [Ictidomys tridecemlineatus]KAG3261771.1 serine incorporator 4, transcript variant X6 [Ictidomys tridecemlineatus]